MLNQSKDFLVAICQNLNTCDIKKLRSANKQFRKDILQDNAYWAEQFRIHFPHLVDKVTLKGQPKNWYLVFEQAYLDEYQFNLPHSGSLVELPASELAKLLTAAKSGNATEFKKLYLEASSGPFDIEPLFYSRDKHGYTCYDWLYQNGHQAILDAIFNDFCPRLDTIFSDKEPIERLKSAKLNLAVACNQKNYFEENAKTFSRLPLNFLLSAARLGSLDLVKLLFEKEINNPEISLPRAFIEAISHDRIEVALFFHKKILQSNDPQIKQEYESTLYQALQAAIFNEHKRTFQKLLEIAKKNNFDINYSPLKPLFINQSVNEKSSLVVSAAKMEDPSYITMALDAGAKINSDSREGSPLEKAIYKGNYETLIVLLQKGAEFGDDDYLRVKDWIVNFRKGKQTGIESSKIQSIDPHMVILVELMLYKHEIKNEPEGAKTLGSRIYEMLHIEMEHDKSVKCRVCDILLEIMIGKRSSKDLDKLGSIEQKVLQNKENPLGHMLHEVTN